MGDSTFLVVCMLFPPFRDSTGVSGMTSELDGPKPATELSSILIRALGWRRLGVKRIRGYL